MSYPSGTVRALLATEHVTPATRAAVQARLAPPPYAPRFLEPAAYALLRAVAARLFPQPERETPIELAPGLDQRLAENGSDGWRYDALPPDGEALRLGLAGLNETAQALHQRPFGALSAEDQDAVLRAVQTGHCPGATWQTLPAARFFEELLAELTELYYCHPLAQEEIGYAGLADQPGWTAIGLDEREDREPAETPSQPGA
ncbi:gluconate 2-dehydrogenase subunit 3 family protein [uncultured Hymenobacter sp.]|uniref:gluconate 2-dehydrogenase subunit 3 family protein n=1 Tax=uncultured Hymenobacter sp. TaxID=170016 RepID=UPI0035CC4F1B